MNKQKFILILALLFSVRGIAQEKINWMSFEEAVAATQKNPKKIFIDVYTDWCGWCKKMDASTFVDPALVKYMNENYYAVKLDAETQDTINFAGTAYVNPNPGVRRSTHQLAYSILNGQMSYPTVVIWYEGNNIHPLPGYRQANELLLYLKYYGENAYKNMSFEEFQKSQSKEINKGQ
jgi:thioredoxin-related protein